MTIRINKYVNIDSGVEGADPMPWLPPVFDPNDRYVLLLESEGSLLLEDGEPILLERDVHG